MRKATSRAGFAVPRAARAALYGKAVKSDFCSFHSRRVFYVLTFHFNFFSSVFYIICASRYERGSTFSTSLARCPLSGIGRVI